MIRPRRANPSAIDPVVFLDLRYDLRISELVRGFNSNNMLRQRLGAAETLLELQLGLTRSEDQKGLGLPQLTDDLVVVWSRCWPWRSSHFFSPPPSCGRE